MPATNAVLHDARYRADGVFCEPPRRLDPAVVATGDAKPKYAKCERSKNYGTRFIFLPGPSAQTAQ